MKILYWTEKYNDKEELNVFRKTAESLSLKHFAFDILQKSLTDLFKEGMLCDVSISKSTEQIRIPKLEYDQLKPQIKKILADTSDNTIPEDHYSNDPVYKEWKRTNFWKNCNAYIFDYNCHEVRVSKEGDEDNYDPSKEIKFMPSIHPFIDEFISCKENRWGEGGEIENMKKWRA